MCRPSHAVGRLHLALGYSGQPVELMLLMWAEVDMARARAPRRDLAGKADIHSDVLDLRCDLVAVEIAAEGVRTNTYVTAIPGSSEFLRLPFGQLVVAGAVRQVEIDPDRGRERPLDVGEALGGEHHDQLCSVVEVRVEVPPLPRSRT